MFKWSSGDRPDARNVAIVITDGAANEDRLRTVPAAVAARVDGVHIVTMAVGSTVDSAMLHSIASPPTDLTVFQALRGRDLPAYRDRLFLTSCDGKRLGHYYFRWLN